MNEQLFIVAESDDEWINRIFDYYSCHCCWPRCSSVFGLGAHHIIRRGTQSLRLLVVNGVLLCAKHHEKVESIKGTERYKRIMVLLIGWKRWELLNRKLEEAMQENTVTTDGMDLPSSEIGF